MEATTEQLNNETHSQRCHQAKLDHSMEAEGWRMGEYNKEGVEGIWEQQGEVVEEKGTEGRGGRGDGNRGERW